MHSLCDFVSFVKVIQEGQIVNSSGGFTMEIRESSSSNMSECQSLPPKSAKQHQCGYQVYYKYKVTTKSYVQIIVKYI